MFMLRPCCAGSPALDYRVWITVTPRGVWPDGQQRLEGARATMRYLVTGTAGFIGFHLARRLLELGHHVAGYDGMTPYYDVALKRDRHRILRGFPRFTAQEGMLEDAACLQATFAAARPDVVVHLAAQAGVRYSLENPRAYVDANLVGTFNVIEACRTHAVGHLLLASTSSAYGGNPDLPFREGDRVAWPLTLYAATKIGTEVMAHAYAHLWQIPTTVFRFFTVYGPWGRPDMALFKFTQAILEGRPIEVFNDGRSTRDFTFVDDLVESVSRLTLVPPDPAGAPAPGGAEASPVAPYRIVNVGGGQPVDLRTFVSVIETALGRQAERLYRPLPAGDVAHTEAKTDVLARLIGYVPTTPVTVGVPAFVRWYLDYYAERAPDAAAPDLMSHA